ncbi:hypothetical protein SUGI_0607180 [Cryptomeria japonica]|nr:hypothetical protein SUGI_0607180 [Cryptomeria japonica]
MDQIFGFGLADWLQINHFTLWFALIQESWYNLFGHASDGFQLEFAWRWYPTLDMSRCVVLDDDFLCCNSCSSSWMLIFLKSYLKTIISDLVGYWCTLFQTLQSPGRTSLWSQVRGMASWGNQYPCMGSVQALTRGYPYALSSSYGWDSEPFLSLVHFFEVLGVGTVRVFRNLHGCIRIIQLRPSRYMCRYEYEFVELLQRTAFHFARRFGDVTLTVVALLDTIWRYVVEFDHELSRPYFLLPKLVIDSGTVDVDYLEPYGHKMLHDIDFNPLGIFSLSIMDGNIFETQGRLVQFWRDVFTDVIRVAQRQRGGFYLRWIWDPGLILAWVWISLKLSGVLVALLEDKQFWEGRIVMSPSQ